MTAIAPSKGLDVRGNVGIGGQTIHPFLAHVATLLQQLGNTLDRTLIALELQLERDLVTIQALDWSGAISLHEALNQLFHHLICLVLGVKRGVALDWVRVIHRSILALHNPLVLLLEVALDLVAGVSCLHAEIHFRMPLGAFAAATSHVGVVAWRMKGGTIFADLQILVAMSQEWTGGLDISFQNDRHPCLMGLILNPIWTNLPVDDLTCFLHLAF